MTKYKPQLVYTPQQRRLHWWVAGLVGLQYGMQSWLLAAMERARSSTTVSFGDFALTTAHVVIGFLVAYLVLIRLRMRRQLGTSRQALTGSPAIGRLAGWNHWLLYAVLLGMVSSGALHYYADWQIAGRVHEWGKWLLAVLVAVHMAGAALHYWRQRV